jgi:Zn-finger nucleic acid-binding protein
MKCPNDTTTLLITDRNGIEIDYCPECRGVWLDRGELDKLIERTGSRSEAPHYVERQERSYEEREHTSNNYDRRDEHHQKKHKKENFLEDFFDFG